MSRHMVSLNQDIMDVHEVPLDGVDGKHQPQN